MTAQAGRPINQGAALVPTFGEDPRSRSLIYGLFAVIRNTIEPGHDPIQHVFVRRETYNGYVDSPQSFRGAAGIVPTASITAPRTSVLSDERMANPGLENALTLLSERARRT